MYTFRKHAREHGTQPCRQALNTAVFTVRTRLCTRAVNTPVYRVHSRARPCSSHGRTMYTACARPCTRAVKRQCTWYTAMYGPCARPCSGHGRTMYMARAWSCTVCTRPLVMYPVHGRPLYTGRIYGRSRRVRTCTPRHSAYQASQKLTAETCWRAITQIQ